MTKVTIIDYGMGNLFSVARALERCGAEVLFTDTAAGIDAAEGLVLPGVGAFSDGMRGLHESGLINALRRYAASARPLMGICLGMQMLLEYSQEFGHHEGLGIIPGRVVSVPAFGADGRPHKIPHIGWNELQLPAGRRDWRETVFEGINPGDAAYFVHSFMAETGDPASCLAQCAYNGVSISAAVAREAVVGCQFHPEKSGNVGLAVLTRFIETIPT